MASPKFVRRPTGTTPTGGTELTTKDYVDNKNRALGHSAPTTNSDHTTTESFAFTTTVNMINGHFYLLFSKASVANLTGANTATFRWRRASGASVAITDAEEYRAIDDVTGGVRPSKTHDKVILWAGSTGQHTWGFSVQSGGNTTRWYGDTGAKSAAVVHLGGP